MNGNKVISQCQIFLLSLILWNCSFVEKKQKKTHFTFADSLWINYRTALEEANLEYLLKNSLDSIGCVDCVRDSLKNEKQIYESKLIFTSYLDAFSHLDSLKQYDFTSYETDSIIYISYSIDCPGAEEGAYGLHYLFRKEKGKFLLEQMFTVP